MPAWRPDLLPSLVLLLAFLTGLAPALPAQITISRQVLPTAAISSDRRADNFLRFTATVGQPLIGTFGDRFAVTVGFQQPDIDGIVPVIEVGRRVVSVSVYPNPTTDRLTVALEGTATDIVAVSLLDPNGRTLAFGTTSPGNPNFSFSGLRRFPAGLYLLRARDRYGQGHVLGRVVLTTHP